MALNKSKYSKSVNLPFSARAIILSRQPQKQNMTKNKQTKTTKKLTGINYIDRVLDSLVH